MGKGVREYKTNTSQITVMVDIDDVLWDLVGHWIEKYKLYLRIKLLPRDNAMSIDKVTNWDIEKCLMPSNPTLFWETLKFADFWETMSVPQDTINALSTLNSHPNIDLIICTDTQFDIAPFKMKKFFELFPFIKREQVIFASDKTRVRCDMIIDDKPETLEKCFEKGCPFVIKIKRNWNKDAPGDLSVNNFDSTLAKFLVNVIEKNITKEKERKLS